MLQAVALYEFDGSRVEILRVNGAYYDLYGYGDLSCESGGFLAQVTPTHRPVVINAFEVVVSTRGMAECEFCRTLESGRTVWARLKLKYVQTIGDKHDGDHQNNERQGTAHIDDPSQDLIDDSAGPDAVGLGDHQQHPQGQTQQIGEYGGCKHHNKGVPGALQQQCAVLSPERGQGIKHARIIYGSQLPRILGCAPACIRISAQELSYCTAAFLSPLEE